MCGQGSTFTVKLFIDVHIGELASTKHVLNSRNQKKSNGDKSGEYGGCWSTSQSHSLVTNCTTSRFVWGDALSCKMISPSRNRSGRFLRMAGRRWCWIKLAYSSRHSQLCLLVQCGRQQPLHFEEDNVQEDGTRTARSCGLPHLLTHQKKNLCHCWTVPYEGQLPSKPCRVAHVSPWVYLFRSTWNLTNWQTSDFEKLCCATAQLSIVVNYQ